MPIDKKEWEQGDTVDTMRTEIIELLEDNSEKAYNYQEVTSNIIDMSPKNGLSFTIVALHYDGILNDLQHEGLVEARRIETESEEEPSIYYRIKTDNRG
jgi:hypothetical protein